MEIVLVALAVFFCLATILPLIRHEAWWIRVFDFPRAQIAIGGVIVAVLYMVLTDVTGVLEVGLGILLVGCVIYQAYKMYPYTPIARDQVAWADESASDGSSLSILISNVLQENRRADRLIELIRRHDPDVVLTVETDQWWAEQLSVLDEIYPNGLEVPLDNTYGMILKTRLELQDATVQFLVEEDIPSMHGRLVLPSGHLVRIHCLHPKPPYPAEDTDTIDRDAELLLVGKKVKERDEPTIVMGDLNDVAWSHTTSLFQRVSGLLDPRIGRGMFASFSANIPILRWPLDHIFHSRHFELVDLQRLPAWGSDHFPILIKLKYSSKAAQAQDEPESTPDDEEEAVKKIEKADDTG